MNTRLYFTLCLAFWTLSGSPVLGDVSWERDQIAAEVHFGEKEINVKYRFKNTTETAKTIQEIRTDCDCTKAYAKENVVPAGESSEINVRYTVGHYTGRTEKNISILMIDDADVYRKTLKLDVTVPAWIQATPKLLTWDIGKVVEATSDVYLHQDLGGRTLKLSYAPDAFSCTLSSDPKDRLHYWLKITPKACDTPCHHEVHLSLADHTEEALAIVTLVVR